MVVYSTEGLFTLAMENSCESLWEKELDSRNNSLNGLHAVVQLQGSALEVLSDRLCEAESSQGQPGSCH